MKKTIRKKPNQPQKIEIISLNIGSLGTHGDGIGYQGEKKFFVPFTLPDEKITIFAEKEAQEWRGKLISIETSSPNRIDPLCHHFGLCGGCVTQHIRHENYKEWKISQIIDPLVRQGISPSVVRPLIEIPPGKRRRTRLSFKRQKGQVIIGFNQSHSHNIFDIKECLQLDNRIVNIIPDLRSLLQNIFSEIPNGQVDITLTELGLDIVFCFSTSLTLTQRENLALFSENYDIGRLSMFHDNQSHDYEIILQRKDIFIFIDGVKLFIPPHSFLQPSSEGEKTLITLVLDGIGEAKKVADLYAGSGTFSIPLSKKAQVTAIEVNPRACEALKLASDKSSRHIKIENRDLTRHPLQSMELEQVEAIVFDPPRAGADSVIESLSKYKKLKPLVYVSCNPKSFIRDILKLTNRGYRLEKVFPIDQFPWSKHLEVVAYLH